MPKFYLIMAMTLILNASGHSQLIGAAHCQDSSFRKSFSIGGDSIECIAQILKGGGNGLILGRHKHIGTATEDGLLIQIDSVGRLQWSVDYLSQVSNEQIRIIRGITLHSGNLLLTARVTSVVDASFNQTILIKTDPLGNIIWSKIILADPSVDNHAVFQLQSMAEGLNEETIVSGTVYGNLNSGFAGQYGFVLKIDASGNSMFSRFFILSPGTVNDVISTFFKNGTLILFGYAEDGQCASTEPRSFYDLQIDYNTGDILNSRRYCMEPAANVIGFANYLHNYEVTETVSGFTLNGFLAESGLGARDFIFVHFDSSGGYTDGFTIIDHLTGKAFHNIVVDSIGSVFLTAVSPLAEVYSSQYSATGTLAGQKMLEFPGFDKLYFVSEGGTKLLTLPDGYLRYINNASVGSDNQIILIQKSTLSNFKSSCLGKDTAFTTVVGSLQFMLSPFNINQIQYDKIDLLDYILSVQVNDVSVHDMCNQASMCTNTHIYGTDTICSTQTPSIFIAVKNADCFQPVQWVYDSSWMAGWKIDNDSVIEIYPKQDLSLDSLYSITALTGCAKEETTKPIVILSSNKRDYTDIHICEGDSLSLTPGNFFNSYLWQDGSDDSLFRTKTPGIYTVIAGYGNCSVKDSFLVGNFRDNSLVNLGSDTTICCDEIIKLHPGNQFASYIWQDNSRDSVFTVSQTV
jgi:hypothetical protein